MTALSAARHVSSPTSVVKEGPWRSAAYTALLLLVFTIPWQGLVRTGIGTISKVVGVAALALAVLAVAREGRRQRLLDAHILMLAFCGWALLSVLWADDPAGGLRKASTLVQLAAMALLVWEFGWSRERLTSFAGALVAGAVVTCALVLQEFVVSGPGASRYAAAGVHPNDIAYTVCLAIPLAWYASLRVRSRGVAAALRLYPALAVAAVVLTASRSAVFVLVVVLLIVPLTARQVSRRTRVGAALVVVALLWTAPSLVPERQFERLASIGEELAEGDLSSRTVLWGIALDLHAQRPFVGIGINQSKDAIAGRYYRPQGAHNTFLSVTLELGAVGLALFLLLLLGIARHGLAAPWLERRLAMVMGGALLVGLQPRHWEDEKALWLVLALVLGLAVAGRHEEDADAENAAAPPGGLHGVS